MHRSTFIQFVLFPKRLLVSLFSRTAKPIFVPAGKDRYENPLALFDGDTFYGKIGTADTDGDIYCFESTRQKKGGPPLHVHAAQDECWFVLSGEFLIRVGDQLFMVRAGDSAFGPRGVAHTFSKVSEGEARMLILFSPAGMMEKSFVDRSKGVTNHMTDAERAAFSKAHGVEIVGPPLGALKQ